MYDESMNSTIKAFVATALFSALGCWMGLDAPRTPELAPELLFYIVLVINTFFSIRFYAAMQPGTISQTLIDAALGLCYVALAVSFGHPLLFAFSALCLFIAAPPKYALMLGRVPHAALLRRKILIDTSGTVACAALLGSTLFGHSLFGMWAFAIVFALANVYLLLIKPMYRL